MPTLPTKTHAPTAHRHGLLRVSAAAMLAAGAVAQAPGEGPAAPPAALVERLNLAPFYRQHLSAGGFPIVGSDKVQAHAFLEARYLIDAMLRGRDDIRARLVKNKVRFAIMAASEMTTAIPEHSDLKPAKYWDRRARGLGATRRRPAVSCGEENLLRFDGDPYRHENILIHELAHAIHQMALNDLDKTFDKRLDASFQAAREAGLWKGKYAGSNRNEYWAEGVQSWFDTNRPPDHDHNDVDTRDELKDYDPGLAALVGEVFGDRPWRYVIPTKRTAEGRRHLANYDPTQMPRFRWPKGLEAWYRDYTRKKVQRKRKSPARGPQPGSS